MSWEDTIRKERTELEQLAIEYKVSLRRIRVSLINTISGDSIDWEKGMENAIKDIEDVLGDFKS